MDSNRTGAVCFFCSVYSSVVLVNHHDQGNLEEFIWAYRGLAVPHGGRPGNRSRRLSHKHQIESKLDQAESKLEVG